MTYGNRALRNDRYRAGLSGLCGVRFDRSKGNAHVIILGIILLIIGIIASIPILLTVGVILVIVGLLLEVLGATGRAVGGRRHYY